MFPARMLQVRLQSETDWEGWRVAARSLALEGTPPEQVHWGVSARHPNLPAEAAGTLMVPRALISLAGMAIQARDPERFDLLYRLVWRAHAGERPLEDAQRSGGAPGAGVGVCRAGGAAPDAHADTVPARR